MGGGVRSYDGYFMYLYFTIEQLTFPQKVKLVNVPCRPNKVDIVELTYIEACDNVECSNALKVEKSAIKTTIMFCS